MLVRARWSRPGGPGKVASRCQGPSTESHSHRSKACWVQGDGAISPPSLSVPLLTLTLQLIRAVLSGQDKRSIKSKAVWWAVGQGDPSTELCAGWLKSLTQLGSKPGHCVLPSPCSAQADQGSSRGLPPGSWSGIHRPAVIFRY